MVLRETVSGTRYGPECVLLAVLSACAINWTCPDVVGWYPHDLTTADCSAVPPRRSKQDKKCPGSVAYDQIWPVTLEGYDCIKAATERLRRVTALAAEEAVENGTEHRRQ